MSTKQVIVVRRDLRNVEGQKIRSGKLMAQTGHAAMMWLSLRIQAMADVQNASADDASVFRNNVMDRVIVHGDLALSGAEADWLLENDFTKIVVGVDSLDELNAVVEKARAAGVMAHVVVDNGATEFGGVKTATCAAIGPDYAEKINPITGHLKTL